MLLLTREHVFLSFCGTSSPFTEESDGNNGQPEQTVADRHRMVQGWFGNRIIWANGIGFSACAFSSVFEAPVIYKSCGFCSVPPPLFCGWIGICLLSKFYDFSTRRLHLFYWEHLCLASLLIVEIILTKWGQIHWNICRFGEYFNCQKFTVIKLRETHSKHGFHWESTWFL